ncbi:glycosyltransferase family 2 protein [Candidatus Bathyarchaeota archaeon A05DMB-2]|nr:glycosyltransferase family 2 protein [Candidatus Bathyarchaeota archaeon A05DMB-2]
MKASGDEHSPLEAPNQKVSVVVPTRNSARTLSRCLQSIKNQTLKPFEIIVVDAFSSDETVQIAKNLGARILQRRCSPAEARNLGISASTGEYTLFLDSDQVLTPLVVEECVVKCVKDKVGMVRIPEVFVGEDFWSICSAVWKNKYEEVEYLYGAWKDLMHGEPRFFVRKLLEEVGMFDTSLLWGEDYDLYERLKRLNVKEGYCTSILYHLESVSPTQWVLKNLRYGETVPAFMRKTNKKIFPSMLRHAMLTFVQVLKEKQKPSVVIGCAFLLWLKACAMTIGHVKEL